MPNIVICCDGTSNEVGEHNTNVVKLYRMLERSNRQVCFYDPGVGTFSSPAALTVMGRALSKLAGKAFGAGLTQNIEEAYAFLMRTWQPGDRIYLFGFSRGAYTARAVAAMLHKCGLLDPSHEHLIPYATKIARTWKEEDSHHAFTAMFARPCPVHFLGLWDTVKSVGWVWTPVTLPFTLRNPSVGIVRHALAIDERRAFFRQNMWGKPFANQDVKEVWFAGVHSDVGGSYPDSESGLAQIALEWMAKEAAVAGLHIDANDRARLIPPRRSVLAGIPGPDPDAEMHNSLKPSWWLAEVFPKLVWLKVTGTRKYAPGVRFNFFRRRYVPSNPRVHVSATERKNYRRRCLLAHHTVEPW